MRVEPLWKGLVSLWNRPQRVPSPLLWWDNIAVSHQLWTRNAGALVLNFLASITVRNKYLWLNHPVYDIFVIVDKTDEDNVKMFNFSSFSIQSLEFMRWSEYTSLLSKASYLVIKSHSFSHSSNIYCASALSQALLGAGDISVSPNRQHPSHHVPEKAVQAVNKEPHK